MSGFLKGWGDLWDVVTGKAQAESDAADAKLKKLNDEAYANGRITREVYDTTNAHIDQGAVNAAEEVAVDFRLGAMEGLDNVASGIKETLDVTASTTANFALKAIPWWVWGIALLWVAWQFGAVKRLVGKALS